MSSRFEPCNGTEGSQFDQAWCAKCQRDASYRRTGKGSGCGILLNMLTGHGSDEWVEDEEGPRCLSFQEIKPKELRKKKKRVKKLDPNQMKLF